MYKSAIILLLMIGTLNAKNSLSSFSQKQLQDDIELMEYFNNYSKNIKGIDFFTVGADSACQYSSIQAAIDDFSQSPFGNIEIRIARNKTYFENIIIDNETLSLVGGYSNCTQASQGGNPGNNQSLIDGNNLESVIRIEGTTQRRTVLLKNLRLLHGTNVGPGGGLVSYLSDVALSLDNVDVRNNTAHYGAGIAIIQGNTDMVLKNSLIIGNVAAGYGGGIYCSGGTFVTDSTVVIIGDTGIVSNFANGPSGDDLSGNGSGGGIYLENNCTTTIYSGSETNGLVGISGNQANHHGGGIYADHSSITLYGHQNCNNAICLGDNDNPVSIRNNTSARRGSAVYTVNSTLNMYASLIEGNTGTSGIYIAFSALNIGRLEKNCWSNEKCNYIINNSSEAIGGFQIHAVDISSVYFEDNNSLFDVSLFSTTQRVPFRVEGCMMNNNGSNTTQYLIDFTGSIDAEFIHNTIANNTVTSSIFNSDYNPFNSNSPFISIHSSIVYNPAMNFLSYDVTDDGFLDVLISAVITNETNTISATNGVINDALNIAGGTMISSVAPRFKDSANGDFHLALNSPAIDYFHTPSRVTVLYKDIDYEERGFDDPVINGQSLFYYDIGADETYGNDYIFVNSFE